MFYNIVRIYRKFHIFEGNSREERKTDKKNTYTHKHIEFIKINIIQKFILK